MDTKTAWQTLRDYAEGRIDHAWAERCPNTEYGHDIRDSDCPVCQALDAVQGCLAQIEEPALEAPAAPKTASLRAALDMFPIDIAGQSFTVFGVNHGKKLEADGDDTFFSKKKVIAFLTQLKGHLDALAAAPQAPAAPSGLPSGWVPCILTHDGQHPEEVAYGPQIMMDRLKKWLSRYFELLAQKVLAEPVQAEMLAALQAVALDVVHVGAGENAISDSARDKVETVLEKIGAPWPGPAAAPAAPILGDAERLAAARQDKSFADYWRNRVAGLVEEFTTAAEARYLADRIVSELYDLPTSGVARPAAPAAPAVDAPAKVLSQAARDVLAERRRQIDVEGWTPEHDDEHRDGAMSIAAACYTLAQLPGARPYAFHTSYLWTWTGWGAQWFKPRDRRHNLVKAAALNIAELERLDRVAAQTKEGGA